MAIVLNLLLGTFCSSGGGGCGFFASGFFFTFAVDCEAGSVFAGRYYFLAPVKSSQIFMAAFKYASYS